MMFQLLVFKFRYCGAYEPPLSIIKQPAFEMGKDATELLLQLSESKRPIKEVEKRILTPELQIRESSVKKMVVAD
jgi:LacI family transcriptional regulator